MAQAHQSERRRYKRIRKNFLLTYYDVNNPQELYEITQLKNISLGGMCMVTSQPFAAGTRLSIDLKTPFVLELTHLEGTVLESHQRVKNIIYETRLLFDHMTEQGAFVLTRIIEYFEKRGE